MKGLYIFISILFLCAGLNAQEVQEQRLIDSLVKVALENNPEIKSADFTRMALVHKAATSGLIPDPRLSIAAVNLPRTSLSLDETPMSGISIGLTQEIPWPGKLRARRHIADLETDIQEQNVRISQNRIARLVTDSYYEYSFWSLAKQINEENLRLTEWLIGITETRYANGQGSAQDVLRAKTAYSRLKNKLRQIETMNRSALFQIRMLLNDTTIGENDLPVRMAYDTPNSPAQSESKDLSKNPEIAKSLYQSDAERRKLSLARADYWPDLMLGLDYRIRERVPMDPVNGEDFLTAKIGIRLPLWFFTKQKNQVRASRLSLEAARQNEISVKLRLQRQIDDLLVSLTTLSESIHEYNQTITPQARAAFETARIAFEVGQTNFDELYATQLDLLEIEIEQLSLLKQFKQETAEYKEITNEIYEVKK
jgi:outer membrane protein TolC